MSHVTKITTEIRDLDALEAACKRLGYTLVYNQKKYAWWGGYVGDAPLPEGFTQDDLGKCDHAIRVPRASYEVGVVRRRDGGPGYVLMYDYWHTGGLEEELGRDAGRLVQAYSVEKTTREARRQGYRVTETAGQDGSVVLTVRRG